MFHIMDNNTSRVVLQVLLLLLHTRVLFIIGLLMIQFLIPSDTFSITSIPTTTTIIANRPTTTRTTFTTHTSCYFRQQESSIHRSIGIDIGISKALYATSSSTPSPSQSKHHPPKRRKRKSPKSTSTKHSKSSNSRNSINNTRPTKKKKKMKQNGNYNNIHLHHHHHHPQQNQNKNHFHPKHDNIILQTLQTNNFHQRLISIQPSLHLPLIANVHANGQWQLCIIHGIKVPNQTIISKLEHGTTENDENGDTTTNNSMMIIPPLMEVILIEEGLDYYDESIYNSKCCIVDIGQITSIWNYNHDDDDGHSFHHHKKDPKDLAMYLSKLLQSTTTSTSSIQQTLFPVNHIEKVMQQIYENNNNNKNHSGSSKSLTKKDITKISSQFQQKDQDLAQHIEQILRRGLKGGLHYSGGNRRGGSTTSGTRMVDSNSMSIQLFENINTNHYSFHHDDEDNDNQSTISLETAKLIIASKVIARDTELGGRFKRTGCIFVSANYYKKNDDDDDNNNTNKEYSVDEICILNGGWTAVDTSVKTSTEARKFVERSMMKGNNNDDDDAAATIAAAKTKSTAITTTTTMADERILHRLECFAMGEIQTTTSKQQIIDLDIRETLTALNLPLTPEGAQKALVQSGRWSSATSTKAKSMGRLYEPWSNDILEVSRNLVQFEVQRKHNIWEYYKKTKSDRMDDGRLNLMSLPCICIDAKRASFRDDAIGVRPRSSTGRKVVEDASKWEILIHIADVSDVYLPITTTTSSDTDMKESSSKNDFDYTLLRKAAETRAISRYDLPFGPLHLMPPVALDALALVTRSIESSNKKLPPVNRCVTLWAYIDERNGKLLDAGLERSIISAPVALTFDSASNLLDGGIEIDTKLLKQVKGVLTIAERNLAKWKENRLKTDKAATEREKRLQLKEMVAKEVISDEDMRDDGSKGSFQRTRGHRIVDNSLDLYGNTLTYLLSKSRAAIPRASGSSAERDARVATAPLRRYIDGIAQRQALSVLCNYGGPPMTRQECDKANKIVNEATKSLKKSNVIDRGSSKRIKSLQRLENHLSSLGESSRRIVPALSTGKANEVIISGLGLSVKCGGVPGSLKTGQRVLVEITKLDTKKGVLKVNLYQN